MTPLLYVKTGCPWCHEAEAWLRAHDIPHEVINVSRDRAAYNHMREISGQSLTPTLDWDGEILADFGIEELVPFLTRVRGNQE